MDGKWTTPVEVEKCVRKNESHETNEEHGCMREVILKKESVLV
jgi:hypothetical protein